MQKGKKIKWAHFLQNFVRKVVAKVVYLFHPMFIFAHVILYILSSVLSYHVSISHMLSPHGPMLQYPVLYPRVIITSWCHPTL
jgi:hypothetical protein